MTTVKTSPSKSPRKAYPKTLKLEKSTFSKAGQEKKPFQKSTAKTNFKKDFKKFADPKKTREKKKNLKQKFWEQGRQAIRQRKEYYKAYDFKKELKKKNRKNKTLLYIFYLKKLRKKIDYTNVRLLKVFLTKFGKIKARRKTRIQVHLHKKITKSIKKARMDGLFPFSCDIVIKK